MLLSWGYLRCIPILSDVYAECRYAESCFTSFIFVTTKPLILICTQYARLAGVYHLSEAQGGLKALTIRLG